MLVSARVTNSNPGPVTYKFEVAAPGSSHFSLIRDFNLVASLKRAQSSTDGTYLLRITARDYLAGESDRKTIVFQATSRVTGGQAVVSPTDHPLVALFSAPSCPSGSSIRVGFLRVGALKLDHTDWRPCQVNSNNFCIGGLGERQTYLMNYEVMTGANNTSGPKFLSFTTGSVPPNLPLADWTVPVRPTPDSDLSQALLLTGFVAFPGSGAIPVSVPVATSVMGNIAWYYRLPGQLTRPLPGGTMLMLLSGEGTGTGVWGSQTLQQLVREVDLAGHTIRETNVDLINEQLLELGTGPGGRFHHDAIRLPNGNTLVFGDVQRPFPPGTQGSAGTVCILGLIIATLDQNWQVIGYWNAFDHAQGGSQLDINRPAIRGEKCIEGALGCPPKLLPGFNSANDWLHANSVEYLPSDGNLLISMRNQDWVVKIDYRDGAGTGDILWRFGKDGGFTLVGSVGDPYPWFSVQHDAAFEDTEQMTLSLLDNGVSRVGLIGGNSRGQSYVLDQASRLAYLEVNVDLGLFSVMLGSAQRLANGNYSFLLGFVDWPPNVYNQSVEVTPQGQVVGIFQGQTPAYRSWRMADLYNPPLN